MIIKDKTVDDTLTIRKMSGGSFFVILYNKHSDNGKATATFDLTEKRAKRVYKYLDKYFKGK